MKVFFVLSIVWVIVFIIAWYNVYGNGYKYNHKKGSIVHNVQKKIMLKHLLPNNGKKFDNALQNSIHKKFIKSEFGDKSINIAIHSSNITDEV